MITNSFRLILFCVLLTFVQFLFNNLTIFYVDLFAIVLISLLLNGGYSWGQLVALSLFADLVGHWFLGTHLLAITILSLFSNRFINFYRLCNWFQRSLFSSIFYLMMSCIIFLVELATGKIYNTPASLIFEIMVLLPLIQAVLYAVIIKKPPEFILYD